MSPTLVRKEDVQRKWYVLDAADKPLGRTAVIAANLLRGKLKPDFTPNVDCGDYVIIVNVEKAVLTGRKLEEKYYRRHSGWIGGLKETKYKTLMAERPEFAMELAVKGMLPKNTIGRTAMTRLKLFKGPEHIHAAQKPAWKWRAIVSRGADGRIRGREHGRGAFGVAWGVDCGRIDPDAAL